MIKKGAMFGLDARIALAIFGALSVISGAALYSAIQDAKVVAIITEAQEIAKAYEAYLLDTGTHMTESGDDFKVVDLVEDNGVAGWQGPYLSYEKASNYALKHNIYGNFKITSFINEDWGDLNGTCSQGGGVPCTVGISFSGIPMDIIKAIETKIDGTASPSSLLNHAGRFRYELYPDNSLAAMFFTGPIVN